MDINFVNIYGLIMSVISVGLAFYLVPRQFKEARKPQDGFSLLRLRLLLQPLLCAVLISFRIPFFGSRVETPLTDNWAGFISVATSTALFVFVLNMYQTYTYKERPFTPKYVEEIPPLEKSPELKKIVEDVDKEVKQ